MTDMAMTVDHETDLANEMPTLPRDSFASLLERMKAISQKGAQEGSAMTRCQEKFLNFVRKINSYFELAAAAGHRYSEWCQRFWELIFLVCEVMPP